MYGTERPIQHQQTLVFEKKANGTICVLSPTYSCWEAFNTLKIIIVTAFYILKVVIHSRTYQETRITMPVPPDELQTIVFLPKKFNYKPSYRGSKIINSLPQNPKTANGNELKNQLHDSLVEQPVHIHLRNYFSF